MCLEFVDDFCLPCEPIAWIWHEGNHAIRCCPIAMIGVVDVNLPDIHRACYQFGSPEDLYDSQSTHSVSSIEHVVASDKVVSTCKNARSTHVEMLEVERFKMRERRKGECRPEARRPTIMPRGERVCPSIFIHRC